MSAPPLKLNKVGQMGVVEVIFNEKSEKCYFQKFSIKVCQNSCL